MTIIINIRYFERFDSESVPGSNVQTSAGIRFKSCFQKEKLRMNYLYEIWQTWSICLLAMDEEFLIVHIVQIMNSNISLLAR